jgi:hypothetical protein
MQIFSLTFQGTIGDQATGIRETAIFLRDEDLKSPTLSAQSQNVEEIGTWEPLKKRFLAPLDSKIVIVV